MAHFLLSIVLLTDAVSLYSRAGEPDDTTAESADRHAPHRHAEPGVCSSSTPSSSSPAPSSPGRGRTAGAATRTTSPASTSRSPRSRSVHGTTVMLFLALVLVTLWLIRRDRAPASVQTRLRCCSWCSSRTAASATCSTSTTSRALLVGIHIAGATAVWAAVLWYYLGLFVRPADAEASVPTPVGLAAAAGLSGRRDGSVRRRGGPPRRRHLRALPALLRGARAPRPDGIDVGAVRGVVGSVLELLEDGATHVGVATDHVIESFRNDLWAGYKTGEGIDPVLLAQFPLLEDALRGARRRRLGDGRARSRRRARVGGRASPPRTSGSSRS